MGFTSLFIIKWSEILYSVYAFLLQACRLLACRRNFSGVQDARQRAAQRTGSSSWDVPGAILCCFHNNIFYVLSNQPNNSDNHDPSIGNCPKLCVLPITHDQRLRSNYRDTQKKPPKGLLKGK